jgi:mRNA-degrading endonuclease toxin of MazEF toxin-antitoxin module
VSGTKYKQREIILVPFPYSDLSSSKRRPVLVVSNDDYNQHFQDVVVCVITSNLHTDEYSVFYRKTLSLRFINFSPFTKIKSSKNSVL